MFWLILVTIILSALYAFVKSTYGIAPLRTIQLFRKLPGPKNLPFFFGLAAKVATLDRYDFLPLLKKYTDENDGFAAYYNMGQPTVVLTNPDYVEPILKSNVNIEKCRSYDLLKAWLGTGLILATGEQSRKRRKLLMSSFHTKILEDNYDTANRIWKKISDEISESNGAPLLIERAMTRGTLSILFEATMGLSLENYKEGESYILTSSRVATNLFRRTYSIFTRNETIFKMTPTGKQTMEDIKCVRSFCDKVIARTKARNNENQREGAHVYSESDYKESKGFIELLIELQENGHITLQDVREEVETIMFAGSETTANALQFAILHLAANPEVQEKAYLEQYDIFGHNDRDVVKEDLTKMNYLEQIIKEVLRLHPTAPVFTRGLVEDVKLSNGSILPSGTRVVVNLFLLHRNAKHFPEPNIFNPDRFSPEASKNRHPYSYSPFSGGPRSCIGQRFGLMELKIALSTFLRGCRFEPVTRYEDIRYEAALVLRTNIPLKVKVFPRN